MDILKMLLDGQDSSGLASLGKSFGLDGNQASKAISGLMNGLGGGVQKNVQSGGLASLMSALGTGKHTSMLSNIGDLVSNDNAQKDGNGILQHMLGGKEASRELASKVSADTGVGSDVLKKMLPILASLAMGAMTKQKNAKSNSDMLTSALSSIMGSKGNDDGLGIDDMLNMAGKFLK